MLTLDVPAASLAASLEDLTPAQQYQVTVRANTSVGFGDRSAPVMATTEKDSECTTPMPHPQYTYATPTTHPCHTHNTPMPHPQHIHATPTTHPCHTHATPTTHPYHTHSTPMPHPQHTHSTHHSTHHSSAQHCLYCSLCKSWV